MPPDLLLTLTIVFISVALFAGTVTWQLVYGNVPERKRLRQLTQRRSDSRWHQPLALTDEPNELAERICRMMPRSARRMDEMRQRLIAAGYRSQTATVVFAASQIISAFAAGALLFVLTGYGAFGFVGMILGFLAPGFWLKHQIEKRGRVIRNGLPDVLDLLIVCLESGSSLDQAILKSSEELAFVYPPLHDELSLVVNEVRAGKPRVEAFRRFADRTGVDDVRSLVSMLVQTERYGTSIADALRTQAEQYRTRRRQHAEERAAKAGVKLVFPLVFCLFPAFYLITLGPAILQFVRVFLGVVANAE